MKADSVSWISPTEPRRSTAITGKAGRYISIESGVKAESSARTASRSGVRVGRVAAVVVMPSDRAPPGPLIGVLRTRRKMRAWRPAVRREVSRPSSSSNQLWVPCYKRTMSSLPELTEPQIRRYARHIVLAEIGGVGQARPIAARRLLVGAGGPGAPPLPALAAAGIGTPGGTAPHPADPSHPPR